MVNVIMTNECFEEKINEIVKFAGKNDNSISTKIFLDILKDKESDFADDVIERAIERLHDFGIALRPEEEDEDYPAEEANTDAFIPAEVNIVQRNVNVYNLMERLENEEIDLAPDFQRSKDLWPLDAQSRLIESLMLKIPIPAFYFDAAKEDQWIVIDGLQRLTAFSNFLVGIPTGEKDEEGKTKRVKERLSGLQYLKDFNGCTFDELPRQYARRIKETSLVAYTVEKGTPDDIVFNIFQRINTGGMVLTAQEIRQALYQGKSTRLIEELAVSKAFITATQGAIRTDRMQDREYITRYIAFTELDYVKEYKENIDNFLIKAMKAVNDHYTDDDIERIEKNFERVMTYCTEIFGKYAFRRFNKKRRGPINKAVFEMWAVCFSELTGEQLARLKKNKEVFFEKYAKLQLENGFITDIGSGSQTAVIRRIEAARGLVREFV